MKCKNQKKFIYEGLGFPIELENVELFEIDNEWHPKIDVKKVADEAIKNLITQKTRLTGNQIKFIRSFFSMSLRQFAEEVVNESHAAVRKWEGYGNDPTKMDINIEKTLRLWLYEKMFAIPNHDKSYFYKAYLEIKDFSRTEQASLVVNLA